MTTPPDPSLEAALDAVGDDGAFDWEAAAAAAAPAARQHLATLQVLDAVSRAFREGDVRAASALPDPPFTWGPLEVQARLAKGASGEVYRARDPRLDRLVALKLLPLDGGSAPISAGMVREGRLLARVHHPHVVAVHGAEQVNGHVGIWMELVEGQTLEHVVQETGPVDAPAVVAIASDLCDALAAVHDAGLVHGDVKAQNVVRTPSGRVVLMDFGAGRDTQQGAIGPLTGTPLYMAPEVLGGGPVSMRSDVYALGVLLHYLLTAAYPFTAASVEDLARARATRRVVDHGTRTPPGLARVIDRALEIDPARRFADTREMARALAGVPHARGGVAWLRQFAMPALLVIGVMTALGWLAVARRTPEGAPAAGPRREPTLRRVMMPDVLLVGRPAPDGRWLSVSDGSGNLGRLWLEDGRLEALTADGSLAGEDSRFAGFSSVAPDGRSIAYGWSHGARPFEVRLLRLDGSPPRSVLAAADVADAVPLDWWPDQQSLLLTLQHRDGTATVARLFLRDGRLHALARLPGTVPEHASLSPDGRWVAYDAPERGAAGPRNLRIVGADGRSGTVLPHPANDFAPLWSDDGRRLLFLSDRSGALDLWSVAARSGVATGFADVLMRHVGRMRLLGLTGSTLFHQRLTGAVDVYLSPLAAASPSAVAETFVGTNLSPRWSPDGSSIAYASRRGLQGLQGGSTILVVRDVSSGARQEWAPDIRAFTVSDWSADGRQVLLYGFDAFSRLGNHVFDLASGRSRPALPVDRDVSAAQFTRDGGLLYVDGARGGVVLRGPTSDGERVLLDFRQAGIEGVIGGAQARGVALSPDERELAYSGVLVENGRRVAVLRVLDRARGETRELARAVSPELLLLHDWGADGREVIVTRRSPTSGPALWRVRVADGQALRVPLAAPALREVSVSPDGTRVSFTAGVASFDVWALEHVLPR